MTDPVGQCFPTPPGTVDRSATTVTVGRRTWLSAELAAYVTAIVLRDYLGYTVQMGTTQLSTGRWYDSILNGEYDLEPESWQLNPTIDVYKRYVVEDRLIDDLGPIGYPGRSGMFINSRLQEREPLADHYRFWQSSDRIAGADILRYPDLDLAGWLGADFPFCKDPTPWCNEIEGYWLSDKCRGQPEKCALLIHPTPNYDTAYFEQLIKNSDMYAFVAYAGWGAPTLIKQEIARGKNVLFYWWEPDPLITFVGANRVSFPDPVFGCLDGRVYNPSGNLSCDYPETKLGKMIRRSMRQTAPEAYYTFAKLQFSPQDMNFMLGLTPDGGGTMSSFEAACEMVKANQARFLADVAPVCVSNPPAVPQTGDLVFDTRLLDCAPFTAYPVLPSPPVCTSGTKGIVDRGDVEIKIGTRDWLTHQLSTAVLGVLLREYLRYNVRFVNASAAPPEQWGSDISTSAYDIDVESALAGEGSVGRTRYVDELAMVSIPGTVGYRQRSSVYVLPHTAQKNEFVDFWRFYETTQRRDTSFYTFNEIDLQAILGSDFPVCKQSVHSWCGTGAFEGWYVPTACQSDPSNCAVVFGTTPDQDTGYFEQLTSNLGLHLVHAYLGVDGLKEFVRQAQASATKDLLFHWYQPEAFTTSVGAVRVSYPDYVSGCDQGNTMDPTTGTVSCDKGPLTLDKLVRKSTLDDLPEAKFLLDRFVLTNDEMQSMLAQHEDAGGSLDTDAVACNFVKASEAKVEQDFVPDCVARPIPVANVRVGDRVFMASEGACSTITCQQDEILIVLGSTVVCQTCPSDRIPNQDQTRCDTCPPGSSPMLQAGTLECGCDPGARRISTTGPTQCELCPAGTRANLPTGATLCLNCTAGRHSELDGSTECLNCTVGTSVATTGASSCNVCEQGYFQDAEASTSCEVCGAHLVTRVLGADSAEACVCQEEFYREEPGRPCMPCPEGMECPLGSDLSNFYGWHASGRQTSGKLPPFPLTTTGYMSLAGVPLSIYECSGVEKCPGGPPGTCGADIDTSSRSCTFCRDPLYWDGSKCAPCHAQAWLFPWLPLLLGPPVIMFVYKISRDESDRWGSWRNCMATIGFLTLNHYQITSVVSAANIRYSGTLVQVFRVYRLTEDPMSLFNPTCAGLTSFHDNVLMRASVPLVLLGVVILTYFGSHIVARLTSMGQQGFNIDRTANVYFSLIFTFFVGICSMALTTFKCADNPNGESTLIADRSVLCYTGEWMGAVAISGVAVLYLIGFGGLFFWATWTAPTRFSDQPFRRRWKFLFIKFRPDVWWWALLFCVKSIVMNAGFMFITVGIFQAYWIMFVVTAYVFATVHFAPWRHKAANMLDIYRCFALIVVISLLASASTGAVINDLDEAVTWGVLVVNASPVFVGALLLAKAIHSQVSMAARSHKENEVRGLCQSIRDFTSISDDRMVRIVEHMDEWGRWHIMNTMRVVGAEVCGVERLKKKRLTDGSMQSTHDLGAILDGTGPTKIHVQDSRADSFKTEDDNIATDRDTPGHYGFGPNVRLPDQVDDDDQSIGSFDGLRLGCKALGKP